MATRESRRSGHNIARPVMARFRRARRVLSPWVRRCLGGKRKSAESGRGAGARFIHRRPATVTAGHTRSLVARVQRTVARATVWQPDVGSVAPAMVARFSGAIVARFPAIGAKYRPRPTSADTEQSPEMPLADTLPAPIWGAGPGGERRSSSPSTPQRSASPSPPRHSLSRRAVPAEQRAVSPPPASRPSTGQRRSPAPPKDARLFSRIEEMPVEKLASRQVGKPASEQVGKPASLQVDKPASGQVSKLTGEQVGKLASLQVDEPANLQVASQQVNKSMEKEAVVETAPPRAEAAVRQVDERALRQKTARPVEEAGRVKPPSPDKAASQQVASQQVDEPAGGKVDKPASLQVDESAGGEVGKSVSEQVSRPMEKEVVLEPAPPRAKTTVRRQAERDEIERAAPPLASQEIPAPRSPAKESPSSRSLAKETLSPHSPTQETPAPRSLTKETPAPRSPTQETPAPRSLTKETPAPRSPMRVTSRRRLPLMQPPSIIQQQVTAQLETQGYRFKRKSGVTPAAPGRIARAASDLGRGAGAGRPLDEEPRSVMESTLGRNFGDVRVHTAQLAPLNVQAASRGRDVYVESGQDSFDTPESLSLLGHELTHVSQPGSGIVRTRPAAQMTVLPLAQTPARVAREEAEADSVEQSIMRLFDPDSFMPDASEEPPPDESEMPLWEPSGEEEGEEGEGLEDAALSPDELAVSPELFLRQEVALLVAAQQMAGSDEYPPELYRDLLALAPPDLDAAAEEGVISIEDVEAIEAMAAILTEIEEAEEEEEPEEAKLNLDRLARQVYPFVKHMLAVERERRVV